MWCVVGSGEEAGEGAEERGVACGVEGAGVV